MILNTTGICQGGKIHNKYVTYIFLTLFTLILVFILQSKSLLFKNKNILNILKNSDDRNKMCPLVNNMGEMKINN